MAERSGPNSSEGFRAKGNRDIPGGAYKRDFNKKPAGRFNIRMGRAKHSRSKSR